MARHGGTPAGAPLPVVSFEKVLDVMAHARDTKLTRTLYNYGYADDSEFTRPESYMQYIGKTPACSVRQEVLMITPEPLESELDVQVEYDMDEQDKEWLDIVNKQRKTDPSLDQITMEVFEIIMDRLEKEWFNLTKNIPKPDFAMPSEDSTCAVCDDSEGENSNAIVFCDGCNLAVHQDCYGIPYVPEGQWLCRKCTVAPDTPVSCLLCPNEGGAFKQTTNGDWVHLLCAIWVPETRVGNEVFMEPITGVERISKQRWRLNCSVCRVKEGACIQCAKSSCFLAFHVTCARKERLLSAMKSAHGTEPAVLTSYCERHLPKEQAEAREAAIAAEEALEEANPGHAGKNSKSARAYTKGYKPGPPIVPAIIVNNIKAYTERVKMRKHVETIQMICRYWSLKREKRRGAPLLKRLHLEPWTASASGKIQTEEEQRMRLDQMHRLLKDLVALKQMSWAIAHRERVKLDQAKTIEEVLDSFLLHREKALWEALGEVKKLDKHDYFLNPVNKLEVPDYFEVVKHPMCWTMIENKLTKHEYWDIEPFKRDVRLVLDNAILYNKAGTLFQKAAIRILQALDPIFTKLYEGVGKALPSEHPAEPSSEGLAPVGDFELPSDSLDLLMSREAVEGEMPIVMVEDPLDFLFKFDMPEDKPPPPPPGRKPRDRTSKSKKKKKKQKEAEGTVSAVQVDDHDMATDDASQPGWDVGFSTDAEPISVEGGRPPLPRRRHTSGTSQDLEVPLLNDVDNQESFKFFEKGWILPPDSKRHNRAPVERGVSVPRPKKRSRNEPGPSHLPDNEGVVPDDPGEPALSAPKEPVHDAEPVAEPTPIFERTSELIYRYPLMQPRPVQSEPAPEYTAVHSEPIPAPAQPSEAPRSREVPLVLPSSAPPSKDQRQRVVEENGKVILETLDTPSIRREKAMARKAERQLAAQEGPSAPGPSTGPGTWTETTATSPLHLIPHKGDEAIELESARPDPTKGSKAPKSTAPSKHSKKRKIPADKVPYPQMKVGGSSEGVDLVQGTLGTYPWWPASTYDDGDPQVPDDALQQMQRLRAKDRAGAVRRYIRFFDSKSSWDTPLVEHMRMLGEDKEFDEIMLERQSAYQPPWRTNQFEECNEAYRDAVREIETSSETGPESGFS